MIILQYGQTNTFLIPGARGGLLVDTGYAGTLPAFYRALRQSGVRLQDVAYVMATHYHPDHMGLISDLMRAGVGLLLIDVQRDFVHFSDPIFAREKRRAAPIDETAATVIACEESRAFLRRMGIGGEIVPTPSHSADSVSVVLDGGDCLVGDLEPYEYLEAYGENDALRRDWERLRSFAPGRIFYAHRPAVTPRFDE